MTTTYFRRTTCRLCEQAGLELVLKLGPSPVGDGYVTADRLATPQDSFPLDLCLCTHCGLLQVPDVVAPEILYGNYLYCTSISLGLAEHFQRYADAILGRLNLHPNSRIVDIGSNDGTLLKCFQKRGMSVLGIDPAAEVANIAKAAGIETITDFFGPALASSIRQEHGSADVVTANNVFANIDDLKGTVAGIRTLLSPDGVFIFETGYMADLIKKNILDNVYHEHISYYSVSPLDIFFRKQGMQLVDIEHVPSKGGSIRGIVQLAAGPRPVSPNVAAMIRLEQEQGLDTLAPFQAFAENAAAIKATLLATLTELKAAGKTIAGYGASVGVTTLIYYFGLAPLLDFLVDDNPSRYNLFSPGHHLQVFPSQVLCERKPDYVLVLAWQYAAPIMAKHREYLDQGGAFIHPLTSSIER